MSKIGIVDAELIDNKKHRFPNLASMKLSAYYKLQGHEVKLITDYNYIDEFDKVYISKVFTKTKVPDEVLKNRRVHFGGTGFFYDRAPPLPDDIEHTKPDYGLYTAYIDSLKQAGASKESTKYYTDYDIGFLTRGCFRQCEFCVNRRYKHCRRHSPISEFTDDSHKKICLLDDNFLACGEWKSIIEQVQETGKRFQFKQGLDERLLTEEKIKEIRTWKYDGNLIFAFDNIEDYDLIESKLQLLRNQYLKRCTFYVLCAYDRGNKYDLNFWQQDIIDLFERIKLLGHYGCYPYIMRYEKYTESPYVGTYINVAQWCNMPQVFNKMSYRDFVIQKDARYIKQSKCMQYYQKSMEIPGIEQYVNSKYFVNWASKNNIIRED